MRTLLRVLLSGVVLSLLLSCGRSESSDQQRHDANTPAGKVGQVAYKASKLSEKMAAAAGRELSKAAHDAHQGWKQASEKDKQRK